MKDQKEFGVWMDNHHATVVGNKAPESEAMVLIGHIKGEDSSPNTSEKNTNHHERTIQSKFFREIAAHLTNATHIHITGTGQAQEQLIDLFFEPIAFTSHPD